MEKNKCPVWLYTVNRWTGNVVLTSKAVIVFAKDLIRHCLQQCEWHKECEHKIQFVKDLDNKPLDNGNKSK